METRECSCRGEFQVAEESDALVWETMDQLRPHFRRQEAYQHAVDYLQSLIADVERKNGWQLAEQAGYRHPRGIQRVLDRYAWDHQAAREDLRRYVVTELGDPDGVLVVDETGFVKQGKHSAGVARQYCGTLGKIANCQIGVFLGYASPRGYEGGAALPRAHPPHHPGNPATLGTPLMGRETTSRANRWLVPLEAPAPEDGPSMPPSSPHETKRGTVVLKDV
jgi:hypothetical protein